MRVLVQTFGASAVYGNELHDHDEEFGLVSLISGSRFSRRKDTLIRPLAFARPMLRFGGARSGTFSRKREKGKGGNGLPAVST